MLNPTSRPATLAAIDEIEADFARTFAEMRSHVHAIFDAQTTEDRNAAVIAAMDFAYDTFADCAPFDALAELWGIESEGIGSDDESSEFDADA